MDEIHFTRAEILRHLNLAHARLSKVESLLNPILRQRKKRVPVGGRGGGFF
ncbi:MAG: hypothetical protein SCAL_000582 [Candidatus Syntrophoarchaeum caldarius]|uniref:Uncharacterized protein n=1 Tax=Candidatus Syntropharchaeum caldarium TaxID=1838285 RepID=A0A1F2PAJ0_9EURY|nr:MAG: hypothetical protein SCAL_000582 [Candidatus Syntrophoarchaeum caldarius]